MKKIYKELKSRLVKLGYTQEDLAERLGKSKGYVNKRMTARDGFSFTETDIYEILDFIEEPIERMSVYFNRGQRGKE